MLSRLLLPTAAFLALALLCSLISGLCCQSAIEKDLTSKVEAVLNSRGLPSQNIRFTGHQLTSTHLDPAVNHELDGIIGAYIPPLTPPQLTTSSWISVTEEPDHTITIKGILQNKNIHIAIIDAARRATPPQGPSRIINNQLEINNQATSLKHQDRLISLIPRLLRQAHAASLSTQEGKIILRGMIDDSSQIAPLLQGLPAESALVVQPLQPLDFKVTRSAEKITLSGTLPSNAMRTSLRQLVESANQQLPISDQTTIALRPAESWWPGHPKKLLPTFLDHSSGPAELHFLPRQIQAQATFSKKGNFATISHLINNLPLRIVRQINLHHLPPPETESEPLATKRTPNPPPAAQHLIEPELPPEPSPLSASLRNLPIYFNKSSTYLKPSEWPKIKQAAQLILNSAKTPILLSGFSSYQSDPQTNQSLALLRAKEVRKRLIKLGVPRKTIEIRAQAPNQNSTDLKKGRRVEISPLTN